MRRFPPALLALALALAGCGATEAAAPAPPPAPTVDPINATACQQFAKASHHINEAAKLIGPGDANGSLLIAISAELGLKDMTAGAKLARGELRDAMERAVAAVQTIHDGAATSPNGRVSMANEVQAARLTIADVVRACKDSGADITFTV